MFILTIRGPDGSEAAYTLGEGEGLIVGRDETADVVLPSKRVSRRHARFWVEGELLNLEDLGSQNGVFVGGARLTGASEVRPGPAIEIGEYTIRVKRQDPRALAAVSVDVNAAAKAHLKGLADMVGRGFDLERERAVVGRDAAAEIHIDNDSVSRRHAELRMEAGSVWVVRDLGSSNGTFVNGERLKEGLDQRLRGGDKVRFGETHWQFLPAAPAAGTALGGLTPNAKKLVAAGGALVLLLAVVAIARGGPGEQPGIQDEVPTEQVVRELVTRGQAAMDEDRFEDAKAAFREAIHEDPVNTEARALLRRAEAEVEHARMFREASNKLDVGRNEEALKQFFRIDPESRFFSRARLKVQDLANVMMKKDAAACRDAGRRNRTDVALETCGRYLDLRCHQGGDAAALDVLRKAEVRAGRRGEWQCPAELAVWFGAATAGSTDHAKELAAQYPDKTVRDAMARYVAGELDAASAALQRARRSGTKGVEPLLEQLAVVEGRYKEGQGAFLRGSLKDAVAAYEFALASDARLVPASVTSFYARQMRTQIAQAFAKEGRTYIDQNAPVEAYEQFTKGLAYLPGDGELLNGLARLERIADGMLANAPACDDLRKVLRITRSEPPSAAHQRARKLFDDQCG